MGLYYLQSRYYDPATQRFINADDPNMLLADCYNPNVLYRWDYCEDNPVMFVDPTGYKIILSGSESNRQKILAGLRNLTGAGITLRVNKKGVVIYDPSIKKYENSDKLIKRMISSKRICTIKITNGVNKTDYQNISASYMTCIGGNVTVSFNPNYNPEVLTTNPKNKVVDNYGKRPAYIGLAHELIHADRSMRGVTINLRSTGYYTYLTRYKRYKKKNKFVYDTVRITAKELREELATVGIDYYNKSKDITENMIRKEHGLWLRGAY